MRDLLRERVRLDVGPWPRFDTAEGHVKRLLKRLDVECVIDVGAFDGGYGRQLRRLGYRGRIVSFEPTPSSFKRLAAEAAGDRLWDVHHVALGAKPGKAMLYLHEAGNMNSVYEASDYGVATYGLGAYDEALVEVMTLDELAVGEESAFLKIDVQGAEFDVLDGAPELLKRCAVLQVEVSVHSPYEGTPLIDESLRRLRELGFTPTGLFPVSWEPDTLKLGDVDCFLVRD